MPASRGDHQEVALQLVCDMCFVFPRATHLQTALDMSINEIGECEDLMEAYWLQVGILESWWVPGIPTGCGWVST